MRLPGKPAVAALAVAAVATALAVAVNLATDPIQVGQPWAWSGVLLLVLLSAWLSPVAARAAATAPPADGAVGALRADVRRVWVAEAAARRVRRPAPLDVRWSSTGRPVAASRRIVLGDGSGREWGEEPLSGGVEEVVDHLLGLPHQRLVVLGAPGAGKSVLAVLLTLGLLDADRAGGRVPVLLPVASWNPVLEDVEDFVARRTAEDHPVVDVRSVRRLIGEGVLLPVLDGLDELPAVWHGRALERVEEWCDADRPLVVTCRSAEYERAGVVLSSAAVVELEPVDVARVVAFLSEPPPARERWAPVLRHLEAEPGGALAGVLSTPLMVSVARAAYRDPHTDPAELLALPDRRAVERTLFDAFLADAYPTPEPDPGGPQPTAPRPRREVRWLRHLAFQLHQRGTRDWRWWEATARALGPEPADRHLPLWLLLPVGLVLGAAATVGFVAILYLPFNPCVAAAEIAVVLALVALQVRSVFPGRYLPAALAVGAALVLAVGVAGLFLWLGQQDRRSAVITGVLLVSLAWSERSPRSRVSAAAFDALSLSFVAIAVRNPVVAGAAVGYLVLAPLLPEAGRAGGTPWSTLSAARRASAVAGARHGALGGALLGAAALWTGTPGTALRVGVVAAVLCGVTAAFRAGARELVRFRCVHVASALLGLWPWRLRRFLEEARARQVLRQAGTALQFRHALLQYHLEEPMWVARLRVLASRDDSGAPYARMRLAEVLAAGGEVDEALDLLRPVGEAVDLLVELLVRERRLDELRAMAAADDPEVVRRAGPALARVLVAEGDGGTAVAVLRAVVERVPGAGGAAAALARLLADRGRRAELRALTHRGGQVAVAAAVELSARWSDEDVDHVLASLRARPSADRVGLADVLVNTGRLDEAVEVLSGDGAVAAVERLARLLAEAGRWDELRDRAESPGGVPAAARLARELVARGDPDGALALLRARLEHRGRARDGDATAVLLADLLVDLGRPAEAAAVLRRRLGSDREGHPEVEDKLVDVLLALGLRDDAMALLRSAADRLDRHSSRAARRLAEVF
ncbi:hypothetical protein ACFV4N_08855 [Actinosynnema sp. NPDC059797]